MVNRATSNVDIDDVRVMSSVDDRDSDRAVGVLPGGNVHFLDVVVAFDAHGAGAGEAEVSR